MEAHIPPTLNKCVRRIQGKSGEVSGHQVYGSGDAHAPLRPQIGYSAIIFYGYVGLVGFALYAFLRYFKSDIKLATVWCIYGERLSRHKAQCACLQCCIAGLAAARQRCAN